MYKRIFKTISAALMITVFTSSAVFADNVTDLQNQKKKAQSDLEKYEAELTYVITQMDELELKMADVSAKIDETNANLKVAEENQKQQYSDMKLRIKYMYEDQSVSISEALLTSSDMSEVLNKAEYIQSVYNYDRSKLDEMAQTAREITDMKTSLEEDAAKLASLQDDMTAKQSLLYKSIDEKKGSISDYDTKIANAQQAAAQELARRNSVVQSTTTVTAKNDSSVASGVVSLAYSLIGTPYVSGGSSPSGFDCSGFTSYLFRQYGITLARSSSAQAGGGTRVSGLANAQPGDIICYPGHVGVYIGGGQIIHANVPGGSVRVASANLMTITAIRRYW